MAVSRVGTPVEVRPGIALERAAELSGITGDLAAAGASRFCSEARSGAFQEWYRAKGGP